MGPGCSSLLLRSWGYGQTKARTQAGTCGPKVGHICATGRLQGSPCCGMLSRDRDSSSSCPEAQHCSAKDFSLSLHLCCPLGSGDPWERSLFWLTVHALLILVPNSYTE